MPAHRWVPSDEQAALIRQSPSITEAARCCGVTTETISRYCQEAGLDIRWQRGTSTRLLREPRDEPPRQRQAEPAAGPSEAAIDPLAELRPWLEPGNDRGPVRLEVRQPSAKVIARRPYSAVILSDIHFPAEDPDAMLLAHDIVRDVRPEVVIINGDLVDFKALSYFPTSPWHRSSFREEIVNAADKLERLIAWAPEAAWIYLEGNHEYRLQRYLWQKAQELAGLDALTVPALLKVPTHVTYLPHIEGYRRRLEASAPEVRLANLYVLHGDTIKNSGNVVNIARTMFLKLLKPVMVGHWHKSQIYLHTDYDGQTTGAWATPCLTGPRADYGTDRVMDQGISIVHVDDNLFEVALVSFLAQGRELRALYQGRSYRRVLGAEGWL